MRRVRPQEYIDLQRQGQWPLTDPDSSCLVNCVKDVFCTFSAPKRVAIGRPQGKCAAFAGCLYWILFVLIAIVYLGWSCIIVNNAHLKYESPMGAVRVSLTRPTLYNASSGHLCDPQSDDCVNDFTCIKEKAYCGRSSAKYAGAKLPCRLWDEDMVVTRNLGEDLVFTTHVKSWSQQRLCEGLEEDTLCDKTFGSEHRDDFFLAGVEDFTLRVAFDVRVPSRRVDRDKVNVTCLGLRVCHRDADADVVDNTGCKFLATNSALASADGDTADFFRLGEMLRFIDVDLDAVSQAHSRDSDAFRRVKGTALALTVHFENTEPYGGALRALEEELPIRYWYSLQELPVKEFKVRTSHWEDEWNADHRIVTDEYGIRLLVMFTGKLGTWSWNQIIVLVSASMITIFSAEKFVVYIIRFSPFRCEGGGVHLATLGEWFMEYSRVISRDWTDTKEAALTKAKAAE